MAKAKKDGPKGKPGRPKMTEAEKAAAKAKREAEKAQAAAPQASSQSSGAASANSGFKKPTADQVRKLVKSLVSMGNESRAISTAVGEKVAKAVETQHFDKKALNIVKSLYQMSINRPKAFAITLPHLLAYIDDLGLAETANEARGMNLEGEDNDGEDAEETAAEADEETDAEHDETPASGPSPRLSVVPGPAAPTASEDVPPAPASEEAA